MIGSQKLFADDAPIAGARFLTGGAPSWPALGLCPRRPALERNRLTAAVYLYSPVRRVERPVSHLAKFKGVVQVDGYAGFQRLTGSGDIRLAACWSHTPCKFYEVQQATGSPIATRNAAAQRRAVCDRGRYPGWDGDRSPSRPRLQITAGASQ
jgi:hypothetical protein